MSHIVHCSDCLDPVTGLASLPDKSVDHVITDPPYEAEAHTLQRRVKRGAVARYEAVDFDPITDETRRAVTVHFARVCRGWILVFCQAEAVSAWRVALTAAGATYKRAAIWVKPDGQPQLSGDRPGMGYESIVCAHVPGRSRWNGGGKHGVYTYCKNDIIAGVEHPTRKPEPLMQALVRDFTNAGELILDPFAGSGTTGVAAKRLGRRFVGWERDPKYHAIAQRRIDATQEQIELRAVLRAKHKQAVLF